MLISLLLLLFLRPFLCSPLFPEANLVYSGLLFIFLLVWTMTKGITNDHNKKLTPLFLIFFTILGVSIAFNHNKIPSLMITGQYVLGALLFLICNSLSYETKDRLIRNMILAGITVSLLALHDYFFVFPDLIRKALAESSNPFFIEYIIQKRIFFPFLSPNTLGGYLILIIPLTLHFKKGLWLALILFLTLLLTQSIGAIFSLFVASILFYHLQGQLKIRNLLILLGLIFTIVCVYYLRSDVAYNNHQPVFSLAMRINYWTDTIHIIKTHPWTGVGLGNFNLPEARDSHNMFLQIWAELGLFGFISLISLITAALRSALRTLPHAPDKPRIAGLLSASLAFLIHNLFDYTFFLPEVSLVWCAIIGLASNSSVSTVFPSRNNEEDRLPKEPAHS